MALVRPPRARSVGLQARRAERHLRNHRRHGHDQRRPDRPRRSGRPPNRRLPALAEHPGPHHAHCRRVRRGRAVARDRGWRATIARRQAADHLRRAGSARAHRDDAGRTPPASHGRRFAAIARRCAGALRARAGTSLRRGRAHLTDIRRQLRHRRDKRRSASRGTAAGGQRHWPSATPRGRGSPKQGSKCAARPLRLGRRHPSGDAARRPGAAGCRDPVRQRSAAGVARCSGAACASRRHGNRAWPRRGADRVRRAVGGDRALLLGVHRPTHHAGGGGGWRSPRDAARVSRRRTARSRGERTGPSRLQPKRHHGGHHRVGRPRRGAQPRPTARPRHQGQHAQRALQPQSPHHARLEEPGAGRGIRRRRRSHVPRNGGAAVAAADIRCDHEFRDRDLAQSLDGGRRGSSMAAWSGRDDHRQRTAGVDRGPPRRRRDAARVAFDDGGSGSRRRP